MPRIILVLRIVAVVFASPILLLGMISTCLFYPVETLRKPLRRPLRLFLGVWDWAAGLPVGYSYWERFEAPAMLDEIVVHHHEDSAS